MNRRNKRLGLVSENTGAIARPLRVDIRKKGSNEEPIEARYKVRVTDPDLLRIITGRNNWRVGTDILKIRANILGRAGLDLPRNCPPQEDGKCPETSVVDDYLEASMVDKSPIPQECVDCIAQYILSATSPYKDIQVAGGLL